MLHNINPACGLGQVDCVVFNRVEDDGAMVWGVGLGGGGRRGGRAWVRYTCLCAVVRACAHPAFTRLRPAFPLARQRSSEASNEWKSPQGRGKHF